MQKTSGASRLNALLNKDGRLVSFDVLKQLPRLSDQRLNLLPLLFDRALREKTVLERILVLFRRT